MTLQEAIDRTWEVYQKACMQAAWGEFDQLPDKEERCKCAEEHRELHEWLYKLKRISRVANDYYNGAYNSAEIAMDIVQIILEEGEGT